MSDGAQFPLPSVVGTHSPPVFGSDTVVDHHADVLQKLKHLERTKTGWNNLSLKLMYLIIQSTAVYAAIMHSVFIVLQVKEKRQPNFSTLN